MYWQGLGYSFDSLFEPHSKRWGYATAQQLGIRDEEEFSCPVP